MPLLSSLYLSFYLYVIFIAVRDIMLQVSGRFQTVLDTNLIKLMLK